MSRRSVPPVLRWAGGKRWLVPRIASLLPALRPQEYVEPFAGGAAVFLAFEWPNPTISDVNRELVATYRALAQDAESVRQRLADLPVSHQMYESVRDFDCSTDVDRAVRLLYLNRCAYGGIYRTNRAGRFNVPFSGDRDLRVLVDGESLMRVGDAMSTASIHAADFQKTLLKARPGAVVYCDPVYALPEAEAHFRRYSPGAFSWDDQCRLAELVHHLAAEDVCVLVSNSADPRVAKLFRGGLTLHFQRRAAFSRANGRDLHEALYVLADRNTLRRVGRRLENG